MNARMVIDGTLCARTKQNLMPCPTSSGSVCHLRIMLWLTWTVVQNVGWRSRRQGSTGKSSCVCRVDVSWAVARWAQPGHTSLWVSVSGSKAMSRPCPRAAVGLTQAGAGRRWCQLCPYSWDPGCPVAVPFSSVGHEF